MCCLIVSLKLSLILKSQNRKKKTQTYLGGSRFVRYNLRCDLRLWRDYENLSLLGAGHKVAGVYGTR